MTLDPVGHWIIPSVSAPAQLGVGVLRDGGRGQLRLQPGDCQEAASGASPTLGSQGLVLVNQFELGCLQISVGHWLEPPQIHIFCATFSSLVLATVLSLGV